MKSKRLVSILLFIAALGQAVAQGDLDPPPGSPAPSMKTLQELWDKVESIETTVVAAPGDTRTPISGHPTFEAGRFTSLAFLPDGQPAISSWGLGEVRYTTKVLQTEP